MLQLRKKNASRFIAIQAVQHEKPTLESRKVMKLHYHDSTSSNDEFSSYAQSIKRIFTKATTYPVTTNTLDFFSEGATLSKFFHEGRRTTTKRTFVAFLSLTSNSTFYECSRSILCQPQHPLHNSSTRLRVIISYSLHLERKITSPSTSISSPYVYSKQSDETIRRLYSFPSNKNHIDDP